MPETLLEWTTLRQQSELSKVAIASKNMMLADSILGPFTNGNIFRVSDPMTIPSRNPPWITVCPQFEFREFNPSELTEIVFPLVITICIVDPRGYLEDNEFGMPEIALQVMNVHMKNSMMEDTIPFGRRALALAIENITAVPYDSIDIEEAGALLFQQIHINYRLEINTLSSEAE